MITLQPMNIQSAAADLLWSRVLKNYPDLRVALSEGGTGWIPYFLDRVDRTFEMHRAWTLQDFGGRLPSEVFREHFLTCFISDPVGVELRDRIGVDNMAWEADYPHSDSMWPTAPEELNAVFEANDVPDDEIRKMTHENAMRWYSFDPFVHVPKAGGDRRCAPTAGRRATTSRSCPGAPGCAPRREARGLPAGPGRRSAARGDPRRGWSGLGRGLGRGSAAGSTPRAPSVAASRRARRRRRARGPRRSCGRRAVAVADRVEQRGVLLAGSALLFGEQLEVAGGHHAGGLAEVGQQAGRARRAVDGTVEPSVGGHDVAGSVDGLGQLVELGELLVGDAGRRPLGGLAGQGGQHREVVDRVLGGDPDDRDAAAGGDLHQALVGELEQRLSHRVRLVPNSWVISSRSTRVARLAAGR